MAQLMRQELASEVKALNEIFKCLNTKANRLSQFVDISPESVPVAEEAGIANCFKTERVRLQQSINSTKATLRDYRDYIGQMNSKEEREAEEAILAAFPTFEEEHVSEDDQDPNQWPVFGLLFRARHLLDRIDAYLVARSEPSSNAGGNSRASTPININRSPPEENNHPEDKAVHNQLHEGLDDKPPQHIKLRRNFSPSPNRQKTMPPQDTFFNSANTFFNLGSSTLPPAQQTHRNFGSSNLRRQQPPPSATFIPPLAIPNDEDALRVNRIEIPRFGGSPEEWVTFWAAFDFAVHSRNYPNFQKHLLLMQYLEKGSLARRMVEGYPPSETNYLTAVGILQRKFGNVNYRRDQLHAQLLHLKPAGNTLKDLRQLQQEIERICTQLANMDGLSATSHSTLVADIIKSKLPHAVVLDLIKMQREAAVPWIDEDWRHGLSIIVEDKEQADLCMKTFRDYEAPPKEQPAAIGSRPSAPHHRHPPRPRQDNHHFENTRAFPAVDQAAAEGQQGTTNRRWGNFCSLCNNEGHRPSGCPTFSTIQQRKKRLEEQGRCLRCLRQDHTTKDCSRQDPCSKCQGRDHHFLLCIKDDKSIRHGGERKKPVGSGSNAEPLGKPMRSSTHVMAILDETTSPDPPVIGVEVGPAPLISDTTEESESGTTLAALAKPANYELRKPAAHLMTQTLAISCHGGPKAGIPAFVFFDPGSQTSYISRSFFNRLQPKQLSEQWLHIHTFGSRNPKVVRSATVSVRIKRTDGGWENLQLSVIDEITTELRALQWNAAETMPNPDTAQLQAISGAPDLLIGIREFWEFFIGHAILPSGLHLITTIFGPMIGGEAELPQLPRSSTVAMVTVNPSNEEAMPRVQAVEEFWNLEAIGIKDDPEQDDDQVATQLFDKSVRQLPNGRYSVSLPWREQHPPLPSNWAMAYRRLLSTTRKLQSSPELLDKYSAELQRQADADIIEVTGRDDEEHFLPHHAVINPKKLRIVIDASAHVKGTPSLNDCLYRGPVLLPDLCGILTRFRLCSIPVLADVQAAFHAIEVEPEDRRFCKILWLKDPHQPVTGNNLLVFRYKKVVFGAVCSPFILAAVLLHHFGKCGHPLAKEMAGNTYVDNLLLECETVAEANEKATASKLIFQEADMNLREFLSHRPEVMEQIPEEDRLDKPNAKVLGLIWDTSSDDLNFKLPISDNKTHTRRSVLSTLSSAFDPLGLIGPCLLPAKRFFQRLWDEKHSWDAPLPPDEQSDWEKVISTWRDRMITVKRHAIINGASDLQLHVFCDASEHTYAAAVYVRSAVLGAPKVRLIFSKNRLRPKKASQHFTIPRMELLAILVGIRAKNFIAAELHRPITGCHVWSDSLIALSWIKSEQPKAQFEQRRLLEIRQKSNATFHFVRTDQNPADIASRGRTPAELQNELLWWEGPAWLQAPQEEWPDEMSFDVTPTDNENDNSFTEEHIGTFAIKQEEKPNPTLLNPSFFKSMLTLTGTILLILRFFGKWRPNLLKIGTSTIPATGELSGEAHRAARVFLIKQDQQHYLSGYDKHPTIINEEGLLCLKTRLTHATGPPTMAAPILLERRSPLTKLIIEEIHRDLKHAGVDWTLTEFLARHWTHQARRTIRGILRRCPSCRRITAPPFARPEMPPLPSARVKPATPFEFIGLDFAGPTPARCGETTFIKTYIVIITCFVTRAVYLEPTRDLSSTTFINVLRRFFSRRGRPKRILSDNAPTFVQTHRALDILTGPPSDVSPLQYAARKGIQWDFIPAYSPWMGACYERLIGLVKSCITKTIGRRILDYDDLSAFLAEVEASINNRPIAWVSDQPDAPKPLTPKDLIQQSGPTDLEVNNTNLDYEDDNLSGPERLAALWKAHREAADHFWHRWSHEYLLTIRERAGWTHKGPRLQLHQTPRVGQVVLVEEDFRPRNLWPMGIIHALNGKLPEIRSVQVRMANRKVITRPVGRLCPLETDGGQNPDQTAPKETETTKDATPSGKALPDQAKLPATPQVEAHPASPMITRRRARLLGNTSTVAMICVFALLHSAASPIPVSALWPLSDSSTENCDENYLNCTNKGVELHSADSVQKITVCCMQFCFDRPSSGGFVFELSSDILVNDYTCSALFWITSAQSCTAQIACSAIGECELIDCYICLEQLANWHCNPRLAAIIASGLLFIFSTAAGWILFCCKIFRHGFKFIYKGVALLLSYPLRLAFYIAGYRWTAEDNERVAQRVEQGARKAKEKAVDRFRQARQQGRRAQRGVARMIGALIVIPALLNSTTAETISVTTSSESCTRRSTAQICSVSSATTLTLLPAGQTSTLLLRTSQGQALGTLQLRLQALDMACHQRSEAWLRSYRVEVLSVKRCPRAGSCFRDHCQQVRPSTIVPELSSIASFPGNTFCQDSTSFWGNDCGLPASSCLYHRFFARPISLRPFELVSCPAWDPQLGIHLQLETNGGQLRETELILHPGISSKWGNITLTPLALSIPPMPILSSKFITDGKVVAMIDQIPLDLHCATEEAARNFNCSLSLSACPECFADHANGAVDCNCRDLDLDALVENPEIRLPITTAKVRLSNAGPAIRATHHYSPVQLHISMQKLSLSLQLDDSLCNFEEVSLRGCYRCSTGASLWYTCRSDQASPLASILCDDGTVFAARCSPNGTRDFQVLPFNSANIDTECAVTCSAGTTTFRLNATLEYIPRQRRFSH